ncbi:hypothetical protein J6590_033436 [Homalodisca vitripennis]|nr:hypothetical protein J6590_033436 [Homalodisca vitripennis]
MEWSGLEARHCLDLLSWKVDVEWWLISKNGCSVVGRRWCLVTRSQHGTNNSMEWSGLEARHCLDLLSWKVDVEWWLISRNGCSVVGRMMVLGYQNMEWSGLEARHCLDLLSWKVDVEWWLISKNGCSVVGRRWCLVTRSQHGTNNSMEWSGLEARHCLDLLSWKVDVGGGLWVVVVVVWCWLCMALTTAWSGLDWKQDTVCWGGGGFVGCCCGGCVVGVVVGGWWGVGFGVGGVVVNKSQHGTNNSMEWSGLEARHCLDLLSWKVDVEWCGFVLSECPQTPPTSHYSDVDWETLASSLGLGGPLPLTSSSLSSSYGPVLAIAIMNDMTVEQSDRLHRAQN